MKKKPSYPKVRFPRITKAGGAHLPAKGGKYLRNREKAKTRQEVKAEAE